MFASKAVRQQAINAGEDGSVIVGKILEKDQYGHDLDSRTGEYGNLVTKCISDPTKAVPVAIQNAASVAAVLITTEAIAANVPKKNTGAGDNPDWTIEKYARGIVASERDPWERDSQAR